MTVVVNAKFAQFRHESNQVQAAAIVSFPNFRVWNVVSAHRNSGAYALNVQFRATQTEVRYSDLEARQHSRFKEDCFSAQRSFEGEVQAFCYGSFQKAFSVAPSYTVNVFVC